MGGGSQTTNSTQSSQSANSLPSWLTSAYQSNLPISQGLQSAGLSATSGGPAMLGSGMNAIGAVNPQSIGAADTSLSNILNGNYFGGAQSTFGAANPQISALASGQYMDPSTNPYLQQSYNLGLQGIQNNVDSQFGAAGRNVLASAPVQADQASTLANSIYGGAYNTNLAAMQNAQGLASSNYNTGIGQIGNAAATSPSVTQGLYTQGNQLLNAGQTPYNLQSWYSQLLGQNAQPFGQQSTTGTTTTTAQNNPGGLATFGGIMSGLGALMGGFGKQGLGY
jgi:hypothetical protein